MDHPDGPTSAPPMALAATMSGTNTNTPSHALLHVGHAFDTRPGPQLRQKQWPHSTRAQSGFASQQITQSGGSSPATLSATCARDYGPKEGYLGAGKYFVW
jgi:hypothetical protein